MAFINEYISEEDIKKYGIRDLWDQFHPYSKNDMNLLKKHSWTIDRDRDVFFIPAVAGKEEKSNQTVCIFWWGGALLVVTLANAGGMLDYENSKGERKWELLDVRKPIGFKVPDVEVIAVLKEALIVFGYDGIVIPINDYKVTFTF